jgi:hypothetical protein
MLKALVKVKEGKISSLAMKIIIFLVMHRLPKKVVDNLPNKEMTNEN